jgi:hypothetical protein
MSKVRVLAKYVCWHVHFLVDILAGWPAATKEGQTNYCAAVVLLSLKKCHAAEALQVTHPSVLMLPCCLPSDSESFR